MRNTYHLEVRAQCPVNKADTDLYKVTIESATMIPVERIAEFFRKNAGKRHVYQEALTRQAAVVLGAKVTTVGTHGDVTVTSVAP